MSKYTTEVRFICENSAGLTESAGYARIDDIINKAVPAVFSFDFPIFDEAYRNVLCKKILKHYYTREICEETVGLWKLRLDTRMNEIMPYYNKLYESELLEFNPLYDVNITRTSKRDNTAKDNETVDSTRVGTGSSENDVTGNVTSTTTSKETSEGTSNGSSQSTSEGTNESTTSGTNESTNKTTNTGETSVTSSDDRVEHDLYSDTPQGALNGVETGTYLTNARKKTASGNKLDTGTSSGETNSTDSGESESTTSGSDSNTTTGTTTNSMSGEVNVSGSGETNQETNTTTTYENNNTYNSTQVKNAESTEDYLETVLGKQSGGSYSKLLMEYRDTFINIDMMVIDNLSDLFFGLW